MARKGDGIYLRKNTWWLDAVINGRRYQMPLKSFKSAFDRACRHANLSGVTPHSLRHTWASRMEMSGASQKTLMELGGLEGSEDGSSIFSHFEAAQDGSR